MKRVTYIAASSLTVVGLATLVIFLEIPERTRFWFELFTAGHTVVFGLCSLACLWLSFLLWQDRVSFRLTHYVIALLIAVVVGAATELIQPYVGRDGEWSDLVRDVLGALAFLFVAMTFDRKLSWELPTGRWLKSAVRVLAILLLALIFWPAMKWGGAYLYRDRQLPVVMDLTSPVMRLFARVANGRLEIVDAPAGWPETKARVAYLRLFPGQYPGLTLRELTPDWSPYQELTFVAYSVSPDTLLMEFRVNDRKHNEKYSDRFNAVLKVAPGVNQFSFPLERIRRTASGRLLDLTDMRGLALFTQHADDSMNIYLSDFLLK